MFSAYFEKVKKERNKAATIILNVVPCTQFVQSKDYKT